MQKTKTIQIGNRPFTLKELPVRVIWELINNDNGKAEQVVEVVSDMSGAFISGVKTHFANSSHTVDWFHVVQLLTKALDDAGRKPRKQSCPRPPVGPP